MDPRSSRYTNAYMCDDSTTVLMLGWRLKLLYMSTGEVHMEAYAEKTKLVVLATRWLPWLQSRVGYERFLFALETNCTRQPERQLF